MRLVFIVESGTDVRLVENLAGVFDLQVIARRIVGGREISQTPDAAVDLTVGPASFAGFGRRVLISLSRGRAAFDAALVQGYGLAALCANLAGWWTGRPVVMLVCSPTEAYYACRRLDAGGRPFRSVEWHALRLLARLNARIGQRYVVLSPYLAAVVRGHGTKRPVDIVPVYGVDARMFSPGHESRGALRARLGLPASAAILFFSSRVAPEKDPDTLLQATRRLRAAGRDVRILHRSGNHREFMSRASREGVADAVIAGEAVPPGPLLVDYYRASDVCVQASREEGLGFSPLEALACRVPVVASAVGGLRDTIVDGETGWTYAAGNATALAEALSAALDDPGEASRRAERGRQLVLARYERATVFTAFAEVMAATVPAGDAG